MKGGQPRFGFLGRSARAAPALHARIARIGSGVAPQLDVEPRSARAPRTPTFKPATVTFVTGHRMNVVIKNVSADGARVEFVQDTPLPDRVYLAETSLNVRAWAYVVWQNRWAAGLSFVQT